MIPRFDASVVADVLGVKSVEFLGAGAFGDTWRCNGRAVKIICVDGYPPERVAREVSGLSRVSSPHVVKLLDSKSINLDGRDRPALFFEFIDGGDLQHRIESAELPSAEDAEALLIGLLRGIRDLHAASGTVHRDIKPQNVALRGGRWDQPVLLDLGLAKSTTETTMTVYPGRVGTPPFMSPEQLQGRRARKAADLFAIGLTVRTAILGRHPFYEAAATYDYDEALERIRQGPVPLPADLPAHFVDVLDGLVSFAEFERGSATSNLRKLGQEA